MPLTTKERKELIDEIMKDLKIQSDRKRELVSRKSVIISPQKLVTVNPSVYGPYYFGTKFAKNPFLTFGQARLNNSNGLLIVVPYVDSWISDSGGVQGFNLGVYAITTVPPGLLRHTISYYAAGKATGYKSDNNSRWTGQYNVNQSRHLVADDGDLEQA